MRIRIVIICRMKQVGDDNGFDSLSRLAPMRTPRELTVVRSQELFGSQRELLIEHAGFHYRLRITQNNNLILTK